MWGEKIHEEFEKFMTDLKYRPKTKGNYHKYLNMLSDQQARGKCAEVAMVINRLTLNQRSELECLLSACREKYKPSTCVKLCETLLLLTDLYFQLYIANLPPLPGNVSYGCTELSKPTVKAAISQAKEEFEAARIMDRSTVQRPVVHRDAILAALNNRFHPCSQEWILVALYLEVPCRDDLHLVVVKDEEAFLAVSSTENYIIIPRLNYAEPLTVVLRSSKTIHGKEPRRYLLSMEMSSAILTFWAARCSYFLPSVGYFPGKVYGLKDDPMNQRVYLYLLETKDLRRKLERTLKALGFKTNGGPINFMRNSAVYTAEQTQDPKLIAEAAHKMMHAVKTNEEYKN